MTGVFAEAVADLRQGIGMKSLWMALAREDISDQHRRTSLGPVWLLVNYLAFIGTFVVIFGAGDASPNYPAYIALGLFVWFYMLEVLNLSITLFVREESFIKGTTLPLTVYVMRLMAQSLIRAGYALAGCLAILLLVGTPVTQAWLVSAFGLLVIVVATPAVITVFATLGVFFPDLQFIVQNLLRLGMFVTPIFWVHGGEGGLRGAFYHWNPFTYFLEIVRVPILDNEVPVLAFMLCLAMTLVLWVAALVVLGHYRKQIVFAL